MIPGADIYVLDANAPPATLDLLISAIVNQQPSARMVVLADRFTEETAFPLLRIGAKGLLTYENAESQLEKALELVASGGLWVPRSLLSGFVESILPALPSPIEAGSPNLTRREREILDCLLANLSNKEIASKFEIAERTVKYHVSNVLNKFGVQRRADLIVLCFQRQSSNTQVRP